MRPVMEAAPLPTRGRDTSAVAAPALSSPIGCAMRRATANAALQQDRAASWHVHADYWPAHEA